MNKITIEQTRESLLKQIISRVKSYDGEYHFTKESIEVYLLQGERVYCTAVFAVEGKVEFDVAIKGFQSFKALSIDLSTDSINRILEAIPATEHFLTIWACEDEKNGSNQVMVYCQQFTALPSDEDEGFGYLNEVMNVPWQRQDSLYNYRAYLMQNDDSRYLAAFYE